MSRLWSNTEMTGKISDAFRAVEKATEGRLTQQQIDWLDFHVTGYWHALNENGGETPDLSRSGTPPGTNSSRILVVFRTLLMELSLDYRKKSAATQTGQSALPAFQPLSILPSTNSDPKPNEGGKSRGGKLVAATKDDPVQNSRRIQNYLVLQLREAGVVDQVVLAEFSKRRGSGATIIHQALREQARRKAKGLSAIASTSSRTAMQRSSTARSSSSSSSSIARQFRRE